MYFVLHYFQFEAPLTCCFENLTCCFKHLTRLENLTCCFKSLTCYFGLCISVYFKTSQNKTFIDPHKISEEIFLNSN